MKCSIFAPAHITGFFEILDHKEPLEKGSRGAGIALDKGVTTTVEITEGRSESNMISISFNGEDDAKNSTITIKVLELMDREFNISKLLQTSQHRSCSYRTHRCRFRNISCMCPWNRTWQCKDS